MLTAFPACVLSKAATLGDKILPSVDKDVLDEGGPQLVEELEEDDSVKATAESKQPDVKSRKAKRSFSQSFSEPELSQKTMTGEI